MQQDMTAAVTSFGATIKWADTPAGKAYVVTGPRNQVAGLITEEGFSIKQWAERLQARVM
jgi:hypothetical protein